MDNQQPSSSKLLTFKEHLASGIGTIGGGIFSVVGLAGTITGYIGTVALYAFTLGAYGSDLLGFVESTTLAPLLFISGDIP
jgi:hypothetical protein